MASRFHQRDTRSSLFSSYDAQARPRPSSASPAPRAGAAYNPYGNGNGNGAYGGHGPGAGDQQQQQQQPPPSGGSYSVAYGGGERAWSTGGGGGGGGFRSATPNSKGQYSDAVLAELESQNDDQVGEMSRKVALLKDITIKIGDEIRDSTAFAEKMNDQFGNASVRLKGTMNRMLRMAERTGVGWKVWLGFFAFVVVLFWYVWLF